MNVALTKTDLTHYVDMCKNFEFNQIQYMLNHIEDYDIIKQTGITQDKHSALVNLSNNFGPDALNEAEKIYTKYYKMKGGAASTYDPKNLTFEQKQKRKLDNAAGAKLARELKREADEAEPMNTGESAKESMGIYRKDKLMDAKYLRKFRLELETVKGLLEGKKDRVELDYKDEHKFKRWLIVDVKAYIAGAKYLAKKMSQILALTDKPFYSTSDMDIVLKKGTVGVDEFIKSLKKVTDSDIKKHKADIEAVDRKPLTSERKEELKSVTYGQLLDFIKTEKKRLKIN